jgi:lysozyme family protein
VNAFEKAFAVVVGHEGGFCAERDDPGNWTGGVVGCGVLRGTKFGISAAAYPTTDIANLTLEAAAAIYRNDYWGRVQGDRLPPALALLVFDAAVNNGVAHAVGWLQAIVGATEDGQLGPRTLAAVDSAFCTQGGVAVCAEFSARRLVFMTGLATWRTFGLGWARRLSLLPYQSMAMDGGQDQTRAQGGNTITDGGANRVP